MFCYLYYYYYFFVSRTLKFYLNSLYRIWTIFRIYLVHDYEVILFKNSFRICVIEYLEGILSVNSSFSKKLNFFINWFDPLFRYGLFMDTKILNLFSKFCFGRKPKNVSFTWISRRFKMFYFRIVLIRKIICFPKYFGILVQYWLILFNL